MMKVLLVRELKCGGLMIKCKLQFWNQLPLLMYILVVLCSHWMLKFVCSSLPGSTMVLLRSTTILTRGTRYCILLSLIFCPPLLYFLLISFFNVCLLWCCNDPESVLRIFFVLCRSLMMMEMLRCYI
jgi:hypothetical protein